MAGVTTSPAGPGPDGGRGAGDVPGTPSRPVAPVDPRAVRIRGAPTAGSPGDPMIRVAPPAEPLAMTNPAGGRGPLGGMAPVGPPGGAGQEAAGVFAHGHPVVDGEARSVTLEAHGRGRAMLVEADGPAVVRTRVVLEPPVRVDGGVVRREVLVDGFRFEVEIEPERIAALRERASRGRAASAHGGPLAVRAIIPGKVVGVSVAPGDAVTAGQQLLAVEAMKMQNELRSPRDGTIDQVAVHVGDNIEVGDLLVVIS
jgi:biotin carboxyl carrier protein